MKIFVFVNDYDDCGNRQKIDTFKQALQVAVRRGDRSDFKYREVSQIDANSVWMGNGAEATPDSDIASCIENKKEKDVCIISFKQENCDNAEQKKCTVIKLTEEFCFAKIYTVSPITLKRRLLEIHYPRMGNAIFQNLKAIELAIKNWRKTENADQNAVAVLQELYETLIEKILASTEKDIRKTEYRQDIGNIYAQLPEQGKKFWLNWHYYDVNNVIFTKLSALDHAITDLEKYAGFPAIGTSLRTFQTHLIQEILCNPETEDINWTPYLEIIRYFTETAEALNNELKNREKQSIHLVDYQEEAQCLADLLIKLNKLGKHTISPELKAAMGGVIGAVLGFVIGLVIVAALTGGTGAFLPLAMWAFVKGLTITTAAFSAVPSLSMAIVGSGIGFFPARKKQLIYSHPIHEEIVGNAKETAQKVKTTLDSAAGSSNEDPQIQGDYGILLDLLDNDTKHCQVKGELEKIEDGYFNNKFSTNRVFDLFYLAAIRNWDCLSDVAHPSETQLSQAQEKANDIVAQLVRIGLDINGNDCLPLLDYLEAEMTHAFAPRYLYGVGIAALEKNGAKRAEKKINAAGETTGPGVEASTSVADPSWSLTRSFNELL